MQINKPYLEAQLAEAQARKQAAAADFHRWDGVARITTAMLSRLEQPDPPKQEPPSE